MKAIETYQKHGLGFEKDLKINGYERFTKDVLDLAQGLKETAPPCVGPITLLAEMFFIGYRTGKRAERAKKN